MAFAPPEECVTGTMGEGDACPTQRRRYSHRVECVMLRAGECGYIFSRCNAQSPDSLFAHVVWSGLHIFGHNG